MRLGEALADRGVCYCQWKGQWTSERWTQGNGDIDLLVDRASSQRFRGVLADLGFKPALPPPAHQSPGLESFFGWDPLVPRLLHIHAHYQLLLGGYWSTSYRLPIEEPLLRGSVSGPIFRTPSPEFALLVFVLRMVQRYSFRQAVWSRRPRWLADIQPELDHLLSGADRATLVQLITEYLPCVQVPFFDQCVQSLRPEAGRLSRTSLRWRLHRRLLAYARPPRWLARLVALVEEVLPTAVLRHASWTRPRLANGGRVVALLGSDGAGKSTCVRELDAWLSTAFATSTAHVGRPPRSLLTLVVGGALKANRLAARLLHGRGPKRSTLDDPAPGATSLELLRHLCTARDRYRLYLKGHRFGVGGGVVISERYPVQQNRLLVGPCIPRCFPTGPPRGLAKALCEAEARYYRQILPPDVLIVLRLHPDLAVRRKPTEPSDYVRARGQVIWDANWSATNAWVVDASRSLAEVVAELRSIVWSAL